ncbi:MAG: gamma carbonic anhydrase family protein [Desulfobacteraceae bacterium]|jgi:carbonic anhydrase/acetyltransferase-like protein (isoleucine patch superfamily)
MLFKFEGKSPVVGPETYISELANVIGDVKIGNNCYIGHGAILRGDYGKIEIEDGTAVEEGVIVHAPPGELCYIGSKVTLGHGAVIHSKHIGDLAVIGMGAILSIRSEVRTRSIIAEGAVVKQNQVIPAEVVAVGNPAKIVRKISQRDEERWDMGKKLYIDLAKRYLQDPMKPVYREKI